MGSGNDAARQGWEGAWLMAGGVVRVVPGRHIRRAELEGVRRISLAAPVMLGVPYGLGVILNQEIAAGPGMLTLHALVGLALIGAALLLLVRAVRLGDQVIAVLAAAGLTAI